MFFLIFIPYYTINTFDPESAKTVAILNLMILNIFLIYFNFSEEQNFFQVLKDKTFMIAISIISLVTLGIYLIRGSLASIGLGGRISEAEYLVLGGSAILFIFIGFFTKAFSKKPV